MAEPWNEEDDRPGIPRRGKTALIPAPPPIPIQHGEPLLRDGDPEVGRPMQKPSVAAVVTTEDRQRLQDAEDEQTRRALAEAEELLASDPALPAFGWFAHPIATIFFLGSFAVLALYLYSQTLSILTNLATQPTWVQSIGYGLLGVLTSLMLYVMFRLIRFYISLRVNRQLRLEGLEELQRRTQLRWLAHSHAADAKTRLEQYLREFPLQSATDEAKLKKTGFTDDHLVKLKSVREELLDPARFASTIEWFQTFQTRFQAVLDEAAANRVSYWSNRAMIVTALSPNGLMDSVSTLYFSFAMITDLCRVYNLRAGRTGTTVLLGRVFFHAYLSGQVNDFEKLAEEQYEQLFHHAFEVIGLGVSTNVVGKMLGKVGAKATTGYLNRVLISRLGQYACRLLRPVA